MASKVATTAKGSQRVKSWVYYVLNPLEDALGPTDAGLVWFCSREAAANRTAKLITSDGPLLRAALSAGVPAQQWVRFVDAQSRS